MKKLVVLISMLSLGIANLFSQDTIPNAGFENWIIGTGGVMDEPVNWGTANTFTQLDSCAGQAKNGGDVHSGSSAIVLTTAQVSYNFPPPTGNKKWRVAGTAVCGGQINQKVPYITGGIPYTKRPTYLKGFCKYLPQQSTELYQNAPVGIDVSNIQVYFFKRTGNVVDTVGWGQLSPSNSTFAEFSVYITFNPAFTGNPDTVQIILASSKGLETAKDSKFYVDDLQFDFTPHPISNDTVGIEAFSMNKFDLKQNSPNPFSESTSIQFNCMVNEKVNFTVVDFLGREVYANTINAQTGLNTFTFSSPIDPGAYFYSISNGKNKITKRMIVAE